MFEPNIGLISWENGKRHFTAARAIQMPKYGQEEQNPDYFAPLPSSSNVDVMLLNYSSFLIYMIS